MFKVFISQPMRGRSDEEIIQERKEILREKMFAIKEKSPYRLSLFLEQMMGIEPT